jgi:predicted site-specific integrase-resolvase
MSASTLATFEGYIRIAEAAVVLGVTTKTLRNWDRAGKVVPRRHPVNGYRMYAVEDLAALLDGKKGGVKRAAGNGR